MIINGIKIGLKRPSNFKRKIFKVIKREDIKFRLKIGNKPNIPRVMRTKLGHKLMKELGYYE